MKIQFVDVGRHKLSWVAEIDTTQSWDDVSTAICIEVEKNGGLVSRGIGCSLSDDKSEGTVFAGFRPAGTFHEYDELNDRYGPAMRAGAEG